VLYWIQQHSNQWLALWLVTGLSSSPTPHRVLVTRAIMWERYPFLTSRSV